jgi:hypothetical protein
VQYANRVCFFVEHKLNIITLVCGKALMVRSKECVFIHPVSLAVLWPVSEKRRLSVNTHCRINIRSAQRLAVVVLGQPARRYFVIKSVVCLHTWRKLLLCSLSEHAFKFVNLLSPPFACLPSIFSVPDVLLLAHNSLQDV